MPRTVNRQGDAPDDPTLHPEGVALQPEATHPHEADPTPNSQEAAEKASKERVNKGIIVDSFTVHDELPPEVAATNRGRPSGQGRPLEGSTLAVLRYLRVNPAPKWVSVGLWKTPNAPAGRLSWAGFFVNDDGEAVAPTEEEEATTFPDKYEVRKKIAYKYGPPDDNGERTLFLSLTDEDWQAPKKRGPRKSAITDVNTTTDTPQDVQENTEPTEAKG